ncbi:MAG: IS21 family transposase [Ruminococcus sp.]|nr:IS21 family transposase [Ruminococcus sp.]
MTNYRKILEMHSQGFSQRSIETNVHSSHQTVKAALDRAKELNISWPLDDDVTNEVLDELFCGERKSSLTRYAAIDYDYIHRELSKKGVTLTLLWQEYCERAYVGGETPYMSTQFGDKYRRWARITKATMRVTHKPGDTMQVDWAGGTIPYYDSVTGEEYKAYLFVAALPCSSYLYVEACTDMKQENWLLCHVHAYEYFGGVTRVLVPDNLKTGVTLNTRYETQLNASYRELAEYYGTAIVPARVRKPQDKGLVEKSVGFSTTWITAALRECKFFSFAEVKDAVEERLEYINTKPFQKRPGSRREAYLAEEKEFMLPLPKRPFEPSVWKQQTVGNDYLISDGLNKYSVPFDLIGEQVQIRLTKDLVEVYFKGSRMTSHRRLEKFSIQPVMKPEHMPSNHLAYLSYNADEFKKWAASVGRSTEEVVKYFLTLGSAPEQGYKACVSLTKLGKRYGKKKLEAACERMLAFSSSPSIRTITTLLKNSKDSDKPSEKTDDSNKYGITCGAAYWRKVGGSK